MTGPDSASAANLREVREKIANAAIRAGRRPEDVTLVAVSKTKPVEAVLAALAVGQTVGTEHDARVVMAGAQKTGQLERQGVGIGDVAAGKSGGSQICKGMRNQKCDPLPSSLCKPMVPPNKVTNCLEMANPKPVPPNCRKVA